MAFHAVVREQVAVSGGELLVAGKIVDRRRQAVAADAAGNTPGAMQCVLQAGGKCLERFRMAEMDVLPVRVREDRMEQHVVERLATDGDLQ